MEPGERWALPKRSTACAEAPQLGGARGQQAGQALLRTYYVPGSIPDVGERDANKTDRVPMAWGKRGTYGGAVNHNHRRWKVPGGDGAGMGCEEAQISADDTDGGLGA